MGTDELPVELERLRQSAAVLDMVYSSNETSFVRAARDQGHRASDGLRMLLHQGVAAFRLWFHDDPDQDVMWNALLAATGRS
jgi:shikimate dehydrogenase